MLIFERADRQHGLQTAKMRCKKGQQMTRKRKERIMCYEACNIYVEWD